MKILTVRQPWAWAIIHGGKDVENRVRNIAGEYRGPVAIHAALAFAQDYEAAKRTCDRLVPESEWDRPLYRGAILGVVNLVNVHRSGDCYQLSCINAIHAYKTDAGRFYRLPITNGGGGIIGRTDFCSKWGQDESWHLVLANPRPFSDPIPYKGALGLREVPADLLARIEAAL